MNKLNASLFSRGLYSSWCYYPTYNLLFDCGEGCATALGNSMPGIDKIFIGHDHGDHTLGLFSFIGCRNTCQGTSKNKDTMADHNKPLTIYYPRASRLMKGLIEFVDLRYGNWLRYKLTWVPIDEGFELELGKDTFLKAFTMKHSNNVFAHLGYVIYTNRTKLKPEFVGKDIPALLRSGVNKADLTLSYRANLFAYCLDAFDIPNAKDNLQDCEHVIMDCTFVNEKDRTDPTHFTLDEAAGLCHTLGVKHMYAAHISPRYDYIARDKIVPNIVSATTQFHLMDNKQVNSI